MIDLMRIRTLTINPNTGRAAALVARTLQSFGRGKEGQDWTCVVAISPADAKNLKVGDQIEVSRPGGKGSHRDHQYAEDCAGLTHEERIAVADLVEGRKPRSFP